MIGLALKYIGKWAALSCLFLFIFGCAEESATPPSVAESTRSLVTIETGADVLAQSNLQQLKGLRVGLIANHTARVGEKHLIDVLHNDPYVDLFALFGPEHGIRGMQMPVLW